MDNMELDYHLNTLRVSDPNYVVDVLNITSEELVVAFYKKAVEFIKEEHE